MTKDKVIKCAVLIAIPIIQSVAIALGSTPGETAKKVGSYLRVNIYMVTKRYELFIFDRNGGKCAGSYLC